MPIRPVPDHNDYNYYLINFDGKGRERAADDGKLLSEIVAGELAQQSVTDVFVMSHGWLGDIPAAIAQYDRWMANLIGCKDDIELMKKKRPGFKPLLIGLHWPSKPFGNEDAGGSFGIDSTGDEDAIKNAIDNQIESLDAPESIRPHLEKIYKAYVELDDPETLPEEVRKAYLAIDRELGMEDDDREEFDPENIFQNAREAEREEIESGSFGGFGLSDLLSPLRMLSFWKMKDRARSFGESGAHDLLRKLQQAAGARDVKFHLMGHSFGCIVVTSMAAGSPKNNAQHKPVNSLMLVQGALSIWSYSPSIPKAKDKPGYFNTLIKSMRVQGPIVVTLSEHDIAVGSIYPLAAGIKRQVDFALELPKYAAIGAYGIQGLDDVAVPLEMEGKDHQYGFKAGRIYNLESSNVIKNKEGLSGAHSDIAHPEVAHAWWQAAIV